MSKSSKTFSWTAVFIGAIAGLGLNFLLNLLSLSIGLSVFSEKSKDVIAFSWIGIIGFGLVAIFSMFTTGWIAGRMTRHSYLAKKWGILYGFIAWCLSFIMTVILLMNMIQFTYFHSSFTSKNPVAIRISNQMPMVTETQDVNSDVSNKSITFNAYITFVFFLIGACSSCVGGYVGYQPREKGKTDR